MTKLVETEVDLRRAIGREEFFLQYQPIVAINTRAIIGFEALVRWQHPERGLIPPNHFISLAEETGLIVPMSLWILREACGQMRQWRERLQPANAPLTVSVNISSKHFQQPDLLEQITAVLRETKISPADLKLEITESAMMDDTERTTEKLLGLRALGIKLSLDDFGTGYSSLSYLHRFPLDTLKIDRSFVSRLDEEGEYAEIVRTILTLAQNLGMGTVAEGVETEAQLQYLQNLGCEAAQGYLFSRPLPAGDVEACLVEMRQGWRTAQVAAF